MLATLRHLGFPSPILDWTKNKYIAAFFAFSNPILSDCVIYRLRKNKNAYEGDIDTPILLLITQDEINSYISEGKMQKIHARHNNQEAFYTWFFNFNQAARRFYLGAVDEIKKLNQFHITKFIIRNSKKEQPSILSEINTMGISYEKLFNETHIYENTLLRDVAVKKFLIGRF